MASPLIAAITGLSMDATAAAGPVGRNATAQTDALMNAEILSWSRSRGVFAGISLDGATLRNDIDENQATPPKFGIRGIPTLMIFKNGNVEATKVGALSKSQLTAFVDSNI